MSWHYLQGQEAACWDRACLNGAPPALLSSTPTAATCSSPDSATAASTASRSGTTCAPSTGARGAAQSTLFPAVSPAKTSAARVAVQDLPATVAAFGSRCSALLARYNLRMCSRKTVRTCVPVASAPSSRDLPAWGMTAAGACWELGTSARHIDETACGSLVGTPAASDMRRPNGQNWGAPLATLLPSPRASDADRGGRGDLLQALRGNPSPSGRFQLPTPLASLSGSNRGGGSVRTGKIRPGLDTLTGGPWIALREWMMGWPIGWSACEPLATGRFRAWLRSHGAS